MMYHECVPKANFYDSCMEINAGFIGAYYNEIVICEKI